MLRVPGSGEKRDIKYIAKEELAVGMFIVVKKNVTVDKEGMYRCIAKELGFTRVGEAIWNRFEEALKLLSSHVNVQDNMVSLKKEC